MNRRRRRRSSLAVRPSNSMDHSSSPIIGNQLILEPRKRTRFQPTKLETHFNHHHQWRKRHYHAQWNKNRGAGDWN